MYVYEIVPVLFLLTYYYYSLFFRTYFIDYTSWEIVRFPALFFFLHSYSMGGLLFKGCVLCIYIHNGARNSRLNNKGFLWQLLVLVVKHLSMESMDRKWPMTI